MLKIWVHFGLEEIMAGSVVADTLDALRNAIKAEFPHRVPCCASQLIVQTKDADNKLQPLKNAELELDGVLEPNEEDLQYRAFVEVPPDQNQPPTTKELLSILASITCDKKQAEQSSWCLSYPVQTNTFQEEKASIKLGQRAIEELKANLGMNQPLCFAVVGCAGIGKSRFCDESQKLFFPSEPSVLIKVAYDILGHSILDQANPVQAFLWRIIAGIYASRELGFTVAHVPCFLDHMYYNPRPFDFADVAKFASEFLPNDQHWILAVDELIKLIATPQQIRQILSFCSDWVRLSSVSGPLRCAVLTSFVPELFDSLTLSNQEPIYICPNLLPGEACLAMAAEYGLQPNTPLVAATILLAGGHPRALYYAFNHLKVTGNCMLVADLASKRIAPQIGPEDVLELIKHSFRPRKFTEFPLSLQVLAKQGSARFALESPVLGWMSSPVPLVMAAIFHLKKQHTQPFSHIWSLVLSHNSEDAPKRFGECIHRFELLKSALSLPVVPEMIPIILPSPTPRRDSHSKQPRVQPNHDWHELKYDFIEVWDDNILKSVPSKGVVVVREDAPDLNEKWAICCSKSNHPHFEAMYEAKFPDGVRVKVLLQAKINNNNLLAAVQGLEEAANLLKSAGWEGLFLFLIVLGENNVCTIQCAHPLVLIKREGFAAYFTPSLAPLLEMQRLIHELQAHPALAPPAASGSTSPTMPPSSMYHLL